MISIFLVIIAAIFKAAMDTLQFHFDTSVFSKYLRQNPKVSWKNKWKNGEKAQGEKFLLSSTALVLFTDWWHLAQFFFLTFTFGAMVVYSHLVNPVVDFVILRLVFGLVFELFYSKLFLKG